MDAPDATLRDRVAALLPSWRAWLRVKHRRLEAQHGDIANEAAADLLAWSLGREASLQEEDLRRVGFRVLQRRVSDSYRDHVREWAVEELQPDLPDPSEASDPVAVLAHKRRLRRLIAFLASLTPDDQRLLVGEELGTPGLERRPMTPAERKRLSRLREKARAALGSGDASFLESWTFEESDGEQP